jgi:hypothetical protein
VEWSNKMDTVNVKDGAVLRWLDGEIQQIELI